MKFMAMALPNNSFNPTALSLPFINVYWFNSACCCRQAAG
jgi:hypothetical protein